MAMLRAQQVSFSYQGKHETVYAVKDFNYDFQPGAFYAIVGKSGSGKTILLSLLAGLEVPTQGQVAFQETPTSQMDCDRYRRDHAAVIYQNFNLFSQLTAQENVMYPLRLQKVGRGEATQRAQEALTQVGLSPAQWRRYPAHLSGGEQQRVAIARTLAIRCEIILADEPTGNLDEENTRSITDLLLRLAHEERRCVIVVTHDLSIAARADAVLELRDGRLLPTSEQS